MTKLTTTTIEHSALWQLKALLALARGSDRQANFLPAGLSNRAELGRHLSALCGESAESGEALVSTTCNRETPLPALIAIKDLAKTLVPKAGSETERAAATLLYHAAVAAALGRHGRNISSRSGSARVELFEDLAAYMAGDPLGQVFQEAADALMTEESESGKQA